MITFRVWGSRGGRSSADSRVGNATSCYSICAGKDLYVFDAGRGLIALANQVLSGALGPIERVHVLITHAHLDHWEGLKDAAWMWKKNNGLSLELWGPHEALDAILRGYAEPSYVPLEILSVGTLAKFERHEVEGVAVTMVGARLDNARLRTTSAAWRRTSGTSRRSVIGWLSMVDRRWRI